MRSLRTVLLAGLGVLNLAVVAGMTATVYEHARREAHAAFEDELRLRARTLAGALEIDREGLEFEVSPRTMPEFYARGSGSYAAVYDAAGAPVRRAPSLGEEQALPATGTWAEGAFDFREVPEGFDGIPCTAVTHSFLLRVDGPGDGSATWDVPTEAQRRYRIVLAKDSRPRDEGLARLLAVLLAVGAAALAVTAAGGLLVARAVLGPVRRMTEEAASLTPEDTSRRLRPEHVVRELASLSATINSALDRLGDALDRQRRFTSDASHELRTPLTVLRGNVELLLRRDRTTAEYREGLERQLRIAERMTEITERLLALARADAGRAELRRESVPLSELTKGVCGDFAAAAAEGKVALQCVTDDPVVVEGDPGYLGELVQNLVSNAVKFTPEGGSVRVQVGRNDGHAVLDVADTGPGVPPEARSRIFERFFRVHEGAHRAEGAGLGLAIVDWIVRAHGGGIDVLEREGGGARFRVQLPLRR